MKKLSFISIIVAAVLWGTSCLFKNALQPYYTPLQMTAIRATTAALFIVIYAIIFNRKLFKVSPKMLIFLVFSGISFYGSAACYYSAMDMTSTSTAAVLMYTAPVMVMIYSVAFMGEKLTPIKLISVALMLVGCCFVSGILGGLEFNLLGIGLAILSGVCYAAYSVLSKIEMGYGCEPLSATLYGAIFMSASSLIAANPVDIIKVAGASEDLWTIMLVSLGLGLCTYTIPSILFNLGMKNLPAGIGSALSIIEPMSATVFGMIFLSEIPSVISFVGIFMILSAVFLLSRDKSAEQPDREPVKEEPASEEQAKT